MAKHSKYRELVGGDKSLWIVILILCVFSILVVYSSTASMAYKNLDGDTSHYLVRQIRFVLLGLGCIYIFHQINYQVYFKNAKLIFRIALVLMCLTFFTGETYNDATRWLRLPYTTFTFQPSDFLKVALIIRLAAQLASTQKIIDRIPILPSFSYGDWKKFPEKNFHILQKTSIPLLFPIAVSCLLVMISNLSTAIIIGLTCVIVLIIGRVKWSEIFRLLLFILVVFILFVALLKVSGVGRVDTWISRIENFVMDDENSDGKTLSAEQYQVHQAKIAVASGWLAGRGPGNSTQRSNLPHPYSDYAYAFIIEEYGVLGALFLLGCYLWIFYRAIVIFRKCDTAFPSLLVLGLSLMITLQALLHMGVSVDAAPVTGQTLPLISLGGSSLLFTCMSLGMILGVSRQQNRIEQLKLLEEKRKLIVEEWEHVVVEKASGKEDKGQKQDNGNIRGRYDDDFDFEGVIWDERHKDNS
ncbi:MAG TPA: FtsW/RodA/SpoVE family cell cycle protein [Candidatus Avirikenella pullistercoris]|nr:FtsW/RodA/SpoVE family cell cycle protein [Candidatus Avirikenella pullistercoris]